MEEMRRGQGRGNDHLAAALERLGESRLEERLLAHARTARRPVSLSGPVNGSAPA
ncbi:MAG: hypothetical protein H0U20_04625 [Thermoleophilaceae bacterium]|nr:hypothetical protein [Thermoleophilaceae bacterium]